MALEKVITEDKIEVVSDLKHILLREKTTILDNGVPISATFHRDSLAPCTRTPKQFDADGNVTQDHTWVDTDVSARSTEVQAIANIVWTDAIKAAYKTHMEAQDT